MSNPYLLLWLEAPLQSWGHDSKFGRRDSLDFPTKSGILGLLCCARGVGDAQSEWLAKWADLGMEVVSYTRTNKDGLPVKKESLLCDFHMVGSGYDSKDPWQSLLIPKTSDGKKAVGGGAKMTFRYYIQDMAYAVILEAPEHLIDNVKCSLENPIWDLYLGRKSCVPTDFIGRGVFETFEEAEKEAEKIAKGKNLLPIFRVKQGEFEGEVFTVNDVPVKFGQVKKYRDRRVTVQKI